MSLVIYTMCVNDIDRVQHMDQESSVYWPRHYFIKSLTSEDFHAFIAQVDNQCVGNIMFRIKKTNLYIDKIVVAMAFRHLGIGGKLLEKAIHIGKTKNAALALLSVSHNNIHAIDFYMKNGFIIEFIQWNHYFNGEHGVRMYRNI